jgi:hypothetical protein
VSRGPSPFEARPEFTIGPRFARTRWAEHLRLTDHTPTICSLTM